MILAIVGSRYFANPKGRAYAEILIVHEVIAGGWDSFVTGDARHGVDAMARNICRENHKPCQALQPETYKWEGFKARNIKIASIADEMLCIRDPAGTNTLGRSTYGSGWTADYMDTLGKLVTRVVIS